MAKFWHKIEHYFGWFYGDVETFYQDGFLMVGFRCDKCHELTGVEKVPDSIFNK